MDTTKIIVSTLFHMLLISSILKLIRVQMISSNMVSKKNLIKLCLKAVESKNLSSLAKVFLHFTNEMMRTKIPLSKNRTMNIEMDPIVSRKLDDSYPIHTNFSCHGSVS